MTESIFSNIDGSESSTTGLSKFGVPFLGVPIIEEIVGGPGVAPGPGVGGDENTGSGDPATTDAGLVDNADPNLDPPPNSDPADDTLDPGSVFLDTAEAKRDPDSEGIADPNLDVDWIADPCLDPIIDGGPVLVEIPDATLEPGADSNPDLAETNLDAVGIVEVADAPLDPGGSSWNGIPAGIGVSDSGSK